MADPASNHTNNSDFYDRISRAYDLLADSSEHAARQHGIEALELSPGDAVLEIGFGTGNALLELAEEVGGDGRVDGIDISRGMLEVASEKIRQQSPAASIQPRLGDARELPYEDGEFDAVFLSFTLELFPIADILRVLNEIRRVLKPGGKLGVVSMALPRAGEHASTLEKLYQWMHRHFPHIVDCQPIDATHLLRDAGYEILIDDELKIWTMPVAVVVGRTS